jgi:hypothetical protein
VIWHEGIGHHSDYDGGVHLPFNVGWCGTCYPRGLVANVWIGVMNMTNDGRKILVASMLLIPSLIYCAVWVWFRLFGVEL